MKNCRYYEMAHLYPFGMLDDAEKKEFEAHIKECPDCAKVAGEAGEVKELSAQLPAPDPGDAFEDRLMQSIRERAAREDSAPKQQGVKVIAPLRWIPARTFMPLAACLAIVFFVAVMMTNPKTAPVTVSSSSTSDAQVILSRYSNVEGIDSEALNIMVADASTALSQYYQTMASGVEE